MRLETFFEKFELFADAPNAVGKMRELVLELAIQGRLVSQDSSDEPATNLLERIAAKKLKAGRVVRAKAGRTDTVVKNESTIHVPDGWAKASLADLVTVLNGRAYSKDELLSSGTPVLRVGNLFTSNHWYYSDLLLDADKYCDKGDLIFAWSASFGPFIWPGPKVIYHYHIWKLELHSEADLSKQYLYWFLQNKTQEIKRAGHGVSMLHMTKEKMEKLEVMIPPISEQKRIVAKVDELMALCDRLEAQQQERDTRHAALARASLARFAEAPTPANLDFLFHPSYPTTPADLRKTILTLAVQGKLVPQDPNDEPAQDLINRLSLEMGEENRRRQAAPLPEIPPDLFQYELPESWAWARFRDVAIIASNLVKPNHNLDFTHLAPDNIEKGNGVLLPCTTVRDDKVISSNHRFFPGQIVYSKIRPNLAKVVIVDFDGLCSADMYPINALIDTKYLHRYMLSESFLIQAVKADTRVAMPKINQTELNAIAIPVPPLAEQHRIVAKVDQLMVLVDQLETQLTASRAAAEKLMQAVVSELERNNDVGQYEHVARRQFAQETKVIAA